MTPHDAPKKPRREAPLALPAVPLTHPAFLLALAVASAAVLAAVTYRIVETDFWQHLVVGREIVTSGRVPDQQVWVWPAQDRVAPSPSWAFRVLLWKFWEAGGFPGLLAWRWLTALAALGIGWLAARRMGAPGFSALVVAAWAALPLRLRMEPRPETLAYVLLALHLLALETTRRAARGSPARWPGVVLPLLALVWANAHISYWLGLVLQAIYLADTWLAGRKSPARRAWLGPGLRTLALSAALSFANPGGWRTLAEPFEYWLVWRHEPIYRLISELYPVLWSENTRNLLWLLVGGWPLLVLLRARRHGFDPAELTIGALFIVQALNTSRFIGFLAVAAVPFVARDLAQVLAGWQGTLRSGVLRRAASPWARAAVASALVAGGLALEWGNPAATPGPGIDPFWRPVAACDFIEREGVRGRSYNDFELGGYLLWRFHPERDRRPFMDIHQTGTREDRRLAALAREDPAAWAALDRRHHFDWALLSRYPSNDWPEVDFLDADTSYALVFVDDTSALYVRRRGAAAAVAERFAYRILRAGAAAPPAIMQAVGDTLVRAEFRTELERVAAHSPFHAFARSWDANLLYGEGRVAEAREALRAAIAIQPRLPFANTRLAQAALTLGRPAEARAAARRGLMFDGPSDLLSDVLFATKGRPGPPDEPIVPAKLPDGRNGEVK